MKKWILYGVIFLENLYGISYAGARKPENPCDILGVNLAKATQALSNEKKNLVKFYNYRKYLEDKFKYNLKKMNSFKVNGSKEMRDQGNTLAVTDFIQEVARKDEAKNLWDEKLLQQQEQNIRNTISVLSKERKDILEEIKKIPLKKCQLLLKIARKYGSIPSE